LEWYAVKVSLKFAVLATLLEGEASGYDLAKAFTASVANFWSAVPQQIYRELEKLEADGLIVGRVVQQDRLPNKRMFILTEAGRADLNNFTRTPTRPMPMRNELLVKVQAVDAGDIDAVSAAVEERMERARVTLARYERQRDRLLGGRSEAEYLRDAARVGPYLTLMCGRMYEEDNIRWAESTLRILAERASARGGTESDPDALISAAVATEPIEEAIPSIR
jgi:DNA-binding PadR family transcriptional regulator